MTLANLIRSLNIHDQTAAQIATVLNTRSITVTVHTFYGTRQIQRVLNRANYAIVSNTLAAQALTDPVVADTLAALRGGGVDFADDDIQTFWDEMAVAGSWTNNVRNKVKEIGIYRVSPWEKKGNNTPVTEAEITAVLPGVRLDVQKKTLRQASQARFDTFSAALEAWDGTGAAPEL